MGPVRWLLWATTLAAALVVALFAVENAAHFRETVPGLVLRVPALDLTPSLSVGWVEIPVRAVPRWVHALAWLWLGVVAFAVLTFDVQLGLARDRRRLARAEARFEPRRLELERLAREVEAQQEAYEPRRDELARAAVRVEEDRARVQRERADLDEIRGGLDAQRAELSEHRSALDRAHAGLERIRAEVDRAERVAAEARSAQAAARAAAPAPASEPPLVPTAAPPEPFDLAASLDDDASRARDPS